ncbi:MAG: hypothetical protein ACTSQP_21355 [Promethearchaeota archaeon]
MPIRFRWSSKEHLPTALTIFGFCGLFQCLYILFAQYLFSIGNYLVIILIPSTVTIAIFYSVIIIFESYAQVERRRKLRTQFKKSKSKKVKHPKLMSFLEVPIVKPLLIEFSIFSIVFFISFPSLVSFSGLSNMISFIIAENIGAIVCLFIANWFENNYAKIRRF